MTPGGRAGTGRAAVAGPALSSLCPAARLRRAAFAFRVLMAAGFVVAAHAPVLAEPVSPAALPGWAADDQAPALQAFLLSCDGPATPAVTAAAHIDTPPAFGPACAAALALPRPASREAARGFFERWFDVARPASAQDGFLTGYYEPELPGARQRSSLFTVPLHAAPPDLVVPGEGAWPAGEVASLTAARRGGDGRLAPLPDRAAIMAGALDGLGLELAFVESPVDAFFAQVQGSVRVRLEDGTVERLGYAGRNGYPYTAIGRILIARGVISREEMTADRLKDWLRSHPDEAPAIMAANRSYVFFRRLDIANPAEGPRGTEGVPLTAGRSLAVDATFHAFGTPLWIMADDADAGQPAGPLNRLAVAQDTGSAIRGAGRGDLFIGSGPDAGAVAGRLRHSMALAVLLPRAEPRP